MTGGENVAIYDGSNSEVLMPGEGARYVCLPKHFFDPLAGQSFDLAINTMSFIEMPGDVVDHYAKGLKSLLMPEGKLFEKITTTSNRMRHRRGVSQEQLYKNIFVTN